MRVAVIGSRTFDVYSAMDRALKIIHSFEGIDEIVSGGARGADSLAEKWAKENNIPTKIFKANWERYGRGAGMIRNKDIIDRADLVVVFWDGQSKGTKNSLDRAKKAGKRYFVIKEELWT